MSTASALRERARRIREVATGFDDAVSATLTELAEGLETEAERIEAELVARRGDNGESRLE